VQGFGWLAVAHLACLVPSNRERLVGVGAGRTLEEVTKPPSHPYTLLSAHTPCFAFRSSNPFICCWLISFFTHASRTLFVIKHTPFLQAALAFQGDAEGLDQVIKKASHQLFGGGDGDYEFDGRGGGKNCAVM